MLAVVKWLSSTLWRAKSIGRARLLPPSQPLTEEPIEWYRPGRYHPVKLGDVYNSRYEVVRKLGWGVCSTVWLAKDSRANRHVALKILSAHAHGCYDDNNNWKAQENTLEREILQNIANTESSHPGRQRIPTLLDSFEHTGPHGKHECLVLPVLGRSLDTFCTQWDPPRVPSPIMREVTVQLLQAIDYLHRECGVIHTDIKPANVLLELTHLDPEHQQDFWIQHLFDCIPVPTGISYPTFDYVQSRSIYAPVGDPSMVKIQLADFGTACWKGRHLTEGIQPILLRAPEVILLRPWSTPVDVWNIGIFLFELVTAKHLFNGENMNDQLARMAACLGPFPKELTTNVVTAELLFDRNNNQHNRNIVTGEQLFNPDGSVKSKISYDGLSLDLGFHGRKAGPKYESPMSQEERRDCIAFLRSMLQLSPQARKTAEELLQDAWLHTNYEYPEYESN